MAQRSKLSQFLICLVLGLLFYGLTFSFVARRPESAGMLHKYFELKLNYANSILGPKLMLLGASNVRYSHRCEVIAQSLAMPCVNAGINNEVALDVLLTNFEGTLHPGDYVYLPLSYEPYMWDQKTLDELLSSVYLFQYSPLDLRHYGWNKTLNALFYYDLPFLFSSFAESVLPRFGVQRMAGTTRKFGIETINMHGDETGHSRDQAAPFLNLHAAFTWSPPLPADFKPSQSDSGKLLQAFLQRSKARQITVIGGLPTVLNHNPIPEEIIQTLQQFYESSGQYFATLNNHSQYPRDCFFDTGYHLNESCQIQHSREVARLIGRVINSTTTRQSSGNQP